MSKKNSSAILKKGFENIKELSKVYLDFKQKIKNFRNLSAIIAISGGPDSLGLAALAKAYSYEKRVKFYYVLINHNIRKLSSQEANQVKSLLKKYKIHLNIITNKVKINNNIQNEARKVRYNLLKKFCEKKNARFIMTAHNLEDQVETFFIRLSRGSGLTGLSSMNSLVNLNNKIKLFRPLLNVKKKNLIKISKLIFGKYFKDPSNKNVKFLRTKIRNLKKPLKLSGINYDQIIKSINNLASSKTTLDQYYRKTFKEIVLKTKHKIELDFKKFNVLNKDIQIRLINDSIKLLKNNYYNPRAQKVGNLIKDLRTNKVSKRTLGGCLFFVNKGKLCLKIQ